MSHFFSQILIPNFFASFLTQFSNFFKKNLFTFSTFFSSIFFPTFPLLLFPTFSLRSNFGSIWKITTIWHFGNPYSSLPYFLMMRILTSRYGPLLANPSIRFFGRLQREDAARRGQRPGFIEPSQIKNTPTRANKDFIKRPK